MAAGSFSENALTVLPSTLMESAVAVRCEAAAFASDPQRVVAGDAETKNIVVGKLGCVFPVVQVEPCAVEAKQAAGSADPEIAVPGLRKCLHHLLGQAVAHAPDLLGIGKRRRLGNSPGGGSADGKKHERSSREEEARRLPSITEKHEKAGCGHPQFSASEI